MLEFLLCGNRNCFSEGWDERFEDIRVNRVSLKEQHQMQVALPSETTK